MKQSGLSIIVAVLSCASIAIAQDTDDGHLGTDDGHPGEEQALPPGHPPIAPAMQGEAAGPSVLAPPPSGRAGPSPEVPPGTIRVRVLDQEGRPVADAAVDVGVMGQGGQRTRRNARSDANGIATFAGLDSGTSQAYRVNVPHQGATYSSTPFQLPTDEGYEVEILRLPVTRDDRYVFFHVFRVVVELRDERIHVIHQVELTNAGRETYVLPASGVRADLPPGALAFQTQAVMTDQRIEEDGEGEGHGYVLRGSLPPGTVQLAWAYDVPVSGATMHIPFAIPMRFFGLQVFAEAPSGLTMSVPGMPPPQRMDSEGQPIWYTQLRRGPEDPAIPRLTVTVSGIPRPGPQRWVAVLLALAFVVGGTLLYFARSEEGGEAAARSRKERRDELVAEARALDADLESGEIGPAYRQSRREAIVREIASLLHEEELAQEKGAPSPPSSKTAGRPARAAR